MDTKGEQKIEGMDTDNLSEEERQKIFEEMDEVFARSSTELNKTRNVDLSTFPSGAKLPVVFSVLLLGVVFVSIMVVAFLLDSRFKREITATKNLKQEVASLAQDIITQGKADLNKKNAELESIQARLDGLLSGGKNLATVYTQRVVDYENKINAEIQDKLDVLEKELQSQNVGEKEITRRLKEQEQRLTEDYAIQLEEYKKAQVTEQKKQEEDYENQIAILQKEYANKEMDTLLLQEEIAEKEQELENKNKEENSQLNETQLALQNLQDQASKKDEALARFDLYHQNITSLVIGNRFVEAKRAIELATLELERSSYRDSAESKTYFDAYATYVAMIEVVISAQKVVDFAEGDVEVQSTQLNLLEASNEELVLANEKLVLASEEQVSNIEKLDEDNKNLSLSNQDLENRLKGIMREYQKTLADLERVRSVTDKKAETEDQIRKRGVQEALDNVLNLIAYLEVKNIGGGEDKFIRKELDEAIKDSSRYRILIERLIEKIDRTGKLRY